MNFYKCPVCGNIVTMLNEKSIVTCCGKELEKLVSNVEEASIEKHIPVCRRVEERVEVVVGDIEHPMDDNHYIMFIAQVSNKETSIVKLNPGDKPIANFLYKENSKIYAYCNIHGLWVCE